MANNAEDIPEDASITVVLNAKQCRVKVNRQYLGNGLWILGSYEQTFDCIIHFCYYYALYLYKKIYFNLGNRYAKQQIKGESKKSYNVVKFYVI